MSGKKIQKKKTATLSGWTPPPPTLLLCLLLGLLSACSFTPKTDYARLALQERDKNPAWSIAETGEVNGDSTGNAGKTVNHLTDLIDSPVIDSLVSEALRANPGIQQTVISLEILKAQHTQTGADHLPTASYAMAGNRAEGGDPAYNGGLSISWELDLWQKLADQEKAAAMDVAEQQALLRGARNSLAAEVMRQYIGLIHDRKSIEIEQLRLANYQKNEQYILQRYRSGIGSLDDLDSARTSSASSRATLEEYTESYNQRRRNLLQILGRLEDGAGEPASIPELTDYPGVIPPLVDLPAQTLENRPDLQAAYRNIQAADLRTRVAYKNLLPSINLGATLEDISDAPSSLLLGDPVWDLLGQLTAPLYQGGKLQAAAHIAELKTANSYQAYRETLLTAVTEVRNSLGLERSLSRQQLQIGKALASSQKTLARYQKNYRAGLVDILDLLMVQSKTYDLALQLDNLVYSQLVNRITLGLALGLGTKTEER